MVSIGGHFSAIIDNRNNDLPGDYGYESARSCLYALACASQPRRIHIPNYICSAIPDVLTQAGIEVARYSLAPGFLPATQLSPQDDEWVLLVDYFGLTESVIRQQITQLPAQRTVVDCSQAYFQAQNNVLATIYSARKFIPVADGGLIATSVGLPTEVPDELSAIRRYRYLLERVGTEPESSRCLYLQSEAELEQASLRSMSTFTRCLLQAVDLEFIRKQRRANFQTLCNLIPADGLTLELSDQVPLCCPIAVPNAERVRAELAGRRIFLPKYWPGISPTSDFEHQLLEGTLFLPVDHRYNARHMRFLAEHILALLA